jgi:hypothetical protein
LKKGIIIEKTSVHKIDYNQMELELANGKKDHFSSIFYYLPYKIPNLLSEAGIDVEKVNKHSLFHE